MNEEDLIRKGWEKRGVYDEPKLSELCEFYKELGFEVIVQPYKPDGSECGYCYEKNKENFKVVFTKKIKE